MSVDLELEKYAPKFDMAVGYADCVSCIKENFQNMAENMVAIGFYLKNIRDKKLYKEGGYNSFAEFAKGEFSLSEAYASRYVSINDRFSVDGNSPFILEDKKAFSKSQLQEMLRLSDEQLEQVTPDMTIKEIRSLATSQEIEIEDIKEEEQLPGQLDIEFYPEVLPDGYKKREEAETIEAVEVEDEEIPVESEKAEVVIDGEYREIETSDEIREKNRIVRAHLRDAFVKAFAERYRERLENSESIEEEVDEILDRVHKISYSFECDGYTYVAEEAAGFAKVRKEGTREFADMYSAVYLAQFVQFMIQDSEATESHDETWFVEQYIRYMPEEAVELYDVCMKEKNNSDRAKAVQKHIAPYGCHGNHRGEYSFVFNGFAGGMDFEICEEKMHLKYGRFVEELMKLKEQSLSAYDLPTTEYEEGSLIATPGCGHKHDCFSCAQECNIRQESRYCVKAPLGNPFSCTTMNVIECIREDIGEECQFINHELASKRAGDQEPVPCCERCSVLCGYRCNRACNVNSRQQDETEQQIVDAEPKEQGITVVEEQTDYESIDFVRAVLEKEKEKLNMYLDATRVKQEAVERHKIIVAALASMVTELELMSMKEEMEEIQVIQPDLPVLRNNDQRGAFIDAYEEWQVWIDTPATGEKYYRYDFENGSSFVVRAYFHKCFDYKSTAKKWEDRYHEMYGSEEYYILHEGKYFKDCLTNRSSMIEFLKNLQKK